MKNRPHQILWGVAIGIFIFIGLVIYAANQARQARFTVDVLEQYLKAYKLVEHRSIESLRGLPDFYLISPYDSLSLRSADLKQGIKNGYIYDFQYLGDDKFVISASPVGALPFRQEFGITDDGVLRMNTQKVDVDADNYEEVEKWPVITRKERVRSKDLPDYLR